MLTHHPTQRLRPDLLAILLSVQFGCGRVEQDIPVAPPKTMAPSPPSLMASPDPVAMPAPTGVPTIVPAQVAPIPLQSSWALCGTLKAPLGVPEDAVFGPNATVVVRRDNGSLAVHDIESGALLAERQGQPVNGWAVSADHRMLVATYALKAHYLSLPGLEEVHGAGPYDPACGEARAFSADGKRVLLDRCVLEADGMAHLLSTSPLTDPVSLGFSAVPGEALVAASGAIYAVRDTGAAAPRLLTQYQAASVGSFGLPSPVVSADGRFFAFFDEVSAPDGSRAPRVHLWRTDGLEAWAQTLDVQGQQGSLLEFSWDSQRLCLIDGCRDVATGKLVKSFSRALLRDSLKHLSENDGYAFGAYSLGVTPLTGVGIGFYPGGATDEFYTLAVSRSDGVLAGRAVSDTFAWQLNEPFEASKTLWRLQHAGYSRLIDIQGNLVAISGDDRYLLNAKSGARVANLGTPPPGFPTKADNREFTKLRFSPDGSLVGGSHYDQGIPIYSSQTEDGMAQQGLASKDAYAAITFSQDSASIFTSAPERFGSDGTLMWRAAELFPHVDQLPRYRWAELSPDATQLLVSGCNFLLAEIQKPSCQTWLYSATLGSKLAELPLTGRYPRFSRDGNWVLAEGELIHLPSRELRTLDPNAAAAVFTSSSDVIIGRKDGTLAKYCVSVN